MLGAPDGEGPPHMSDQTTSALDAEWRSGRAARATELGRSADGRVGMAVRPRSWYDMTASPGVRTEQFVPDFLAGGCARRLVVRQELTTFISTATQEKASGTSGCAGGGQSGGKVSP